MNTFAHAKINLLLSVRPGPQADGYHHVETVMCPLELADEVDVRLRPGAGVALACAPDPLPAGSPASDNIAYRAAVELARDLGRDPGCRISIVKNVPSQAGLGGGSSDAAAVLRCLARLWEVDPCDPAVYAVAARLGADVPFFLRDVPAHLTGRGDVLREMFCGFSLPLVLVKPSVGVSTGQAYWVLDQLAPAEVASDAVVAALRCGDAPAVPLLCANNMQTAARAIAPELDGVFAFLESQPALVGSPLLCGSGSCTAAFVRSDQDARLIARAASDRGWWACATRTLV